VLPYIGELAGNLALTERQGTCISRTAGVLEVGSGGYYPQELEYKKAFRKINYEKSIIIPKKAYPKTAV